MSRGKEWPKASKKELFELFFLITHVIDASV